MLAIAAAVLLLLVAAGVFLWKRPASESKATGGVKRIAVLPFENLGAAEDDYFADGISDEVRSKLTSLPGVEVIARASSTSYKKITKKPREIAEELGVNYLLTATVRWQRSGGATRVHVTPELVEVKASGAPASKWQQPFDASLTDVFQVQSDIASRVAESLGVALAEGQKKQLSERPTQNLAAYDAYLKGEEALGAGARTDPPSLRKALEHYGQAVALDPGFALAWARIALANSLRYTNTSPTPEVAERAREAAEKAAALAPDQADVRLALGAYYRLVRHDLKRALEEYTKGRQIAPGNPALIRSVALVDEILGRWDEALEHARQAERLDPRGVGNIRILADLLLMLRRSSEARQVVDRGLALSPDHLALIERNAMTFLSEGNLADARAVLKDAEGRAQPTALVAYVATFQDLVWLLDGEQTALLRRLTPASFDDDEAAWALCQAQACAFSGDAAGTRDYAERARKTFETQLAKSPDDYNLLSNHLVSLGYAGRRDEVLREAERVAKIWPLTRDAYNAPYVQHQIARAYTLVGEHEKAIDVLESLLKTPYFVSAGWLKIDPNFDPLRKNPRFQKLVASAK